MSPSTRPTVCTLCCWKPLCAPPLFHVPPLHLLLHLSSDCTRRSALCGLSQLDFHYFRKITSLINAGMDVYSQIIDLLLPLCLQQLADLSQRSYRLLRRLFIVFFLNSIISVYHLSPAAPCSANTFFCHSNMCINNSLVCNGVQNCVYPWDENHCKGKHLSLADLFTVGYFG